MDVLKSLVQPLVGGGSNNSAIDGLKLVVLGGAVETARRASSTAWNHFVNSFFLTAHFTEDDFPYDWLMLWLSRRPEWQRSREVETTTRSAGPGGSSSSSSSRHNASSGPSGWGMPPGMGGMGSMGGGNPNGSGGNGSSTVGADTAAYNDEDRDWDMWEAALYAETHSASGVAQWGASGNDDFGLEDGIKPRTRVSFQPTYDTTHTIFYRGHWLRVRRGRKDNGSEMLSISVIARSNAILKQLVLQAKKEYEAAAVHRIQLYFADAHGSWRWTDSRHKRPLSSIVLNPGVKEMLVEDARDFLRSEKWYADRGIPFRRGYLLHGVPGSGKSSLIHALAGQLHLDIYVVSLSASWISDTTLTSLMGRVPARCVLLLEDLDAAFVRSVNREDGEDGEGEGGGGGGGGNGNNNKGSGGNGFGSGGGGNYGGFGNNGGLGLDAFPSFSGLGGRPRRRFGRSDGLSDMNTLSLSGLLNALDGVTASEGRLLFATTNHLDRLDPALSRPGRMDVWVEFRNASRWQAEALFRNFFPCEENSDTAPPTPQDEAAAAAEFQKLNLNLNFDEKVETREFRPNGEAVKNMVAMLEAKAAESSGSVGSSGSGSSEASTTSSSMSVSGFGSTLGSLSFPASNSASGASTPRTPRTPQTRSEPLLIPDLAPPPPSTLWSLSTSIASSATSLLSLSGSVLGSAMSASGVSTASSPTAVSRTASQASQISQSSQVSQGSQGSQASNAPAQPIHPNTTPGSTSGDGKEHFGSDNTAYMPPPPDTRLKKPKPLDKKTLAVLAKRFADGVPEEEFSVASLQGYLLKHKAKPQAAANGIDAWVKSELEMRERLQREKEAREEREKEQREKRKKENAERQKVQKETEDKERELERVKALLAEKDKEDELEKMRQQLKEKEAAAKKKRERKERKERKAKKEQEEGKEVKDEEDGGKKTKKEKKRRSKRLSSKAQSQLDTVIEVADLDSELASLNAALRAEANTEESVSLDAIPPAPSSTSASTDPPSPSTSPAPLPSISTTASSDPSCNASDSSSSSSSSSSGSSSESDSDSDSDSESNSDSTPPSRSSKSKSNSKSKSKSNSKSTPSSRTPEAVPQRRHRRVLPTPSNSNSISNANANAMTDMFTPMPMSMSAVPRPSPMSMSMAAATPGSWASYVPYSATMPPPLHPPHPPLPQTTYTSSRGISRTRSMRMGATDWGNNGDGEMGDGW